MKILEVIEDLEEKHNQNQAKLADARSKYKHLVMTYQEKAESPKLMLKKKKKILV
jgi:hypothetical protein